MGTGLGRSWMRAPNFRRLPKLQRFFGGGRARGPEVGGTEVARERRGFVGNTLHHGPSTAALGHGVHGCTTDRRDLLGPFAIQYIGCCDCYSYLLPLRRLLLLLLLLLVRRLIPLLLLMLSKLRVHQSSARSNKKLPSLAKEKPGPSSSLSQFAAMP